MKLSNRKNNIKKDPLDDTLGKGEAGIQKHFLVVPFDAKSRAELRKYRLVSISAIDDSFIAKLNQIERDAKNGSRYYNAKPILFASTKEIYSVLADNEITANFLAKDKILGEGAKIVDLVAVDSVTKSKTKTEAKPKDDK